jgi:RND superfamily putative drug exporter
MTLLGDLNWWAPKVLRRIHERVGLQEGHVVAAPALIEAPPEAAAMEV